MTITHQDIADRLEQLGRERSKAYDKELERIRAERKSLQEHCASLGHIMAPASMLSGINGRCCCVCGVPEVGATRLKSFAAEQED